MLRIPRAFNRGVLAGLLFLLSAAWIVWQVAARHAAPDAHPTQPAIETPEDAYAIYFTQPEGPMASTLRGGPDAVLVAAIDRAARSVDFAVYEMDLWSIRDALIRAHRRGVQVRIVTDDGSLEATEVAELAAEGIPIFSDRDDSLMHHKFVILDGAEVWTGSMNLTVTGAYRNDNNLVLLRSEQLARRYLEEFEEMAGEGRFGILSSPVGGSTRIGVNGIEVEALFSPGDRVAARILSLLQSAQESIHFMAFTLTLDSIAEALIERARAGVAVQGVLDASQARNPGSDLEALRGGGIRVELDGNPAKMHHKVIIIDGRIVITGSYNFSRSAEERNDENVLVIYSPEVASRYLIEFERIMNRASE